MKQDPIEEVLQIGKSLTLAANQPARIFSFDIQQETFFQVLFFDRGWKAQVVKQFFECSFGICRHKKFRVSNFDYDLRGDLAHQYLFFLFCGGPGGGFWLAPAFSSFARVSLVWAMVNRF